MKKVLILLAVAFVIGCAYKVDMSSVPKGAKFCGNDGECSRGEYCGFYGVDSPAVCKPKPQEIRWH
jgi:hypothetical protein